MADFSTLSTTRNSRGGMGSLHPGDRWRVFPRRPIQKPAQALRNLDLSGAGDGRSVFDERDREVFDAVASGTLREFGN
jgi:hypothetical protein